MKKQNESQLNISFAEKFSIKSKEYVNTPVRSLSLSVRAINCFTSNGISTLESLLNSTPQSLLELKGFGRTCLDEVENFCSKLTDKNIKSLPKSKKNGHCLSAFRPYYKFIALGDFSFSDKLNLSDSENETLIMLKETFNLLGEDEITTTTPIFKLQIWDQFPQINVSWTDWLLYSTLNKWGHKVSVSTSSNQFRMAVPLVAPIGKMDTVTFADVVPNKDNLVKIDNLDDIDSLLEDILADDILEEKYEL